MYKSWAAWLYLIWRTMHIINHCGWKSVLHVIYPHYWCWTSKCPVIFPDAPKVVIDHLMIELCTIEPLKKNSNKDDLLLMKIFHLDIIARMGCILYMCPALYEEKDMSCIGKKNKTIPWLKQRQNRVEETMLFSPQLASSELSPQSFSPSQMNGGRAQRPVPHWKRPGWHLNSAEKVHFTWTLSLTQKSVCFIKT